MRQDCSDFGDSWGFGRRNSVFKMVIDVSMKRV